MGKVKAKSTKRGWRKWCVRGFLLALISCVALVLWAQHATVQASAGKLYESVDDVPADRVAVVFGCAAKIDGRDNLYFIRRIDAAMALWEAGKVRGFIVSGDNSRSDYSEPDDMKAALVERGVPAERVVCDYAGLRTLDTVVRTQQIFGVDKAVFVSQEFHNERALYLAKYRGLDAVAYNAEAVVGRIALRTDVRERLARVKMLLDVHLLGQEPKYLGEEEALSF